MQQQLGRPLRADEDVHHINGDRSDNRPENLELWSSSQPRGQRISEKLEWARWLIAEYEHLPLSGGERRLPSHQPLSRRTAT